MPTPHEVVEDCWVSRGFGNPCKMSLYALVLLYKAVVTAEGSEDAFKFKVMNSEPVRRGATVSHNKRDLQSVSERLYCIVKYL